MPYYKIRRMGHNGFIIIEEFNFRTYKDFVDTVCSIFCCEFLGCSIYSRSNRFFCHRFKRVTEKQRFDNPYQIMLVDFVGNRTMFQIKKIGDVKCC